MEITCYFILGIFHRTAAPLHIQIIIDLLNINMHEFFSKIDYVVLIVLILEEN